MYLKNTLRCKVMAKSHFFSFCIVCLFSESTASNIQVSTFSMISEVTVLATYDFHSQVLKCLSVA